MINHRIHIMTFVPYSISYYVEDKVNDRNDREKWYLTMKQVSCLKYDSIQHFLEPVLLVYRIQKHDTNATQHIDRS